MATGCSINDGGVFQETHLLGTPNPHAYLREVSALLFTIVLHLPPHTTSAFLAALKSDVMDGNARRRGPRRVPAPQAPPGSRQSDRIRGRVGVARANPPAPVGRILISDSSSVNRFSDASGHSDSDPFFIPGMVPGPPEEEEVDAPPNSAGEEEDRAAEVGGDGVAEGEDGPPSPNMGGAFRSVEEREALYAFSAAGPSVERVRAASALDQTRSHDFYQGRRLGRLENQVACMEAEIHRLQGQLAPLRERLRARRQALAPEFGWKVWVPSGNTSSDED
jgi:hypothetical protein